MISIFVAFGIFFIFLIVGLSLFKALRIPVGTGFAVIPVAGALAMACLAQLFGLILPMQSFAWVFSGALLVLSVLVGREAIQWLREVWKHKAFITIVFASLCLLSFPMLKANDLISVQKENEDILFYLSSMDWLSGHTILDKAVFSPELPYYSAASYMLRETRFGFDILGALLKSVLHLKAHELFLSYSVVLTVLGNFAVYELCLNGLKMEKKWALTALAVVAAGGNWVTLILWQYAPQIFGVTALLAFTGCVFRLHREGAKGYIFLTGLTLIATLCVYAEFALYLLVIYLAVLAPPLLSRDRSDQKKNSLAMIKAGLLGFALNPAALYIAVKLNLKVFTVVLNTQGAAINSAGRSCATLGEIGAMLFGFHDHADSAPLVSGIFGWAAILPLILFGITTLYAFIKKHTAQVISVLAITGFLIVYGLLFLIMGTEYPLFKHIIAASPFAAVFLFYQISICAADPPLRRAGNFLGLACGVCLVILNVQFVCAEYTSPHVMTYDDQRMQVSAIENIDTDGQAVTIPENFSMHENHLFAYALQGKPIRFLSNRTYFFGLARDDNKETTDYILIRSGDYRPGCLDIFSGLAIEKVWDNGIFCLIHSEPGLRPQVLSGFHACESYSGGSFRWTSENESVIGIQNSTGGTMRFKISLLAGDAPDGTKKKVQVIAGGQVIGEGLSGAEIVTESVGVEGEEKINVTIKTSEPLSVAGNEDPRLFGIFVASFQIIEE